MQGVITHALNQDVSTIHNHALGVSCSLTFTTGHGASTDAQSRLSQWSLQYFVANNGEL